MTIYDNNGFVDVPKIIHNFHPLLVVIIGGRSTGKTYGVCKYLYDRGLKFVLIRRTEAEREFIRDMDWNPLSPLVDDEVIPTFEIEKGKYIDCYKNAEDKDAICYTMAIATAAKTRGFNGRHIKAVVFDEFIKDNNERSLADEAGGFYQIMSTITRDRELKGEDPPLIFLLANANNIFNPIFTSMNLYNEFIGMRNNGYEYKYLKKKRIFLADLQRSPKSEALKQTYLFQLTQGTEFYKMAVDNRFSNQYILNLIGPAPFPLTEYKPFIHISGEGLYILIHPEYNHFFITTKNRGVSKIKYISVEDFLKRQQLIMLAWLRAGVVMFENMAIAEYFKDVL